MIRKLLILAASLFIGGASFAVSPLVWISSYTATADATKPLCDVTHNNHRAFLHSVCVEDTGTGTGTFSIFNASSTAVNPIAVLRSTSAVVAGCYVFDVMASSGLVYTNSAANGTTILYQCL